MGASKLQAGCGGPTCRVLQAVCVSFILAGRVWGLIPAGRVQGAAYLPEGCKGSFLPAWCRVVHTLNNALWIAALTLTLLFRTRDFLGGNEILYGGSTCRLRHYLRAAATQGVHHALHQTANLAHYYMQHDLTFFTHRRSVILQYFLHCFESYFTCKSSASHYSPQSHQHHSLLALLLTHTPGSVGRSGHRG